MGGLAKHVQGDWGDCNEADAQRMTLQSKKAFESSVSNLYRRKSMLDQNSNTAVAIATATHERQPLYSAQDVTFKNLQPGSFVIYVKLRAPSVL